MKLKTAISPDTHRLLKLLFILHYEILSHRMFGTIYCKTKIKTPLRIVRVCLCVYAGKRIISVDGAVTEVFDIGTSIVANSGKILGHDPKEMGPEDFARARERIEQMGIDASAISDEQIRQGIIQVAESFREEAPMTAADAATVILDGVREEKWRFVVGHDAQVLDRMVRDEPENAYSQEFYDRLAAETNWRLGALNEEG